MQRRWLFLTLVVGLAVAAALLAASASADKPTKTPITFAQTSPLTGVCSFPITVDAQGSLTFTDFFDSSGTLVRRQVHTHEQDVFSANGISLTGIPFSFNLDFYFAPDGTTTAAKAVGIVDKIPPPNGKLFIMAGQTDLTTLPPGTEFIFTVTQGNPGDTDALCAALTP
jgi:hypothetical protein